MDGNMFISEKIDGTNACIVVRNTAGGPARLHERKVHVRLGDSGYATAAAIYAQSRNRIITPADDNYGFAQFVWDNAQVLADGLNFGRHFGEWWGRGINRGYGLDERWFSLFNTGRWNNEVIEQKGMGDLPVAVVPLLVEHGRLDTRIVDDAMRNLAAGGSHAAPGFMNPEGVVVYHAKSGNTFKKTYEGDASKWALAQGGAQVTDLTGGPGGRLHAVIQAGSEPASEALPTAA